MLLLLRLTTTTTTTTTLSLISPHFFPEELMVFWLMMCIGCCASQTIWLLVLSHSFRSKGGGRGWCLMTYWVIWWRVNLCLTILYDMMMNCKRSWWQVFCWFQFHSWRLLSVTNTKWDRCVFCVFCVLCGGGIIVSGRWRRECLFYLCSQLNENDNDCDSEMLFCFETGFLLLIVFFDNLNVCFQRRYWFTFVECPLLNQWAFPDELGREREVKHVCVCLLYPFCLCFTVVLRSCNRVQIQFLNFDRTVNWSPTKAKFLLPFSFL